MKDSKKYSSKIDKWYKKAKKDQGKVKPIIYDDPVEAIVFAIICNYLPLRKSKTVLNKIKRHFVDFNDLRVSRSEELVEVLGGDSEQIRLISHELTESLNAVFSKYDTMDISPLKEERKRQVKKELEEIEKLSKFVISYCFLTVFDGHAIPVSEDMADYLHKQEMVHPKATVEDIEGFLERQINSSEGNEFFIILKTESDKEAKKSKKKTNKKKDKKSTKKKAAPKKKTKKATKKKTSKKKAAKKTVKKKETKKTVKKAKAKKKK